MKNAFLILALAGAACLAETSLSLPLVGVVRDPAGRLHKVFGAAGAFVLGPAEYISDLQTPNNQIEAGARSQDGNGWLAGLPPDGDSNMPARLERQGKQQALVLRKSGGEEERLGNGRLAGLPPDGDSNMPARLERQGKQQALVLRKSAGEEERLRNGWLAGLPPDGDSNMPARLERQGKQQALVLRKPGGEEERIPLPAPAGQLQYVGDGWLAAFPFIIRITADGATIYRLPEPAQ